MRSLGEDSFGDRCMEVLLTNLTNIFRRNARMDTWHLTLYCKSIHLYSQTLIIFILQGYIQTSVSVQLSAWREVV